ncbi:MAG: TM2 domain-containing protein [Clostridia bacterium]|nr:TM2 domain-containing protein [Clostridia bacterium]
MENKSEKDWLVTLLLSIFVGSLGIHRFYVGKIGTGILQLITLGGCGIWSLIDIIMIITGKFTDSEGKVIENK